jgi:2-amino-4-hydroxy-6-hydroxymethyldihydropteridine diphosphokinase
MATEGEDSLAPIPVKREHVTDVVLSLGANLGDRFEALTRGIDIVCRDPAVEPVAVSAVYETDPVGGPEQPDYLNAVLRISTTLEPIEVLALAQLAELELARERSIRWGPRTLDVDVINYGDVTSSRETLILPHPRAAQRAFVLLPLADVAPDVILAGQKESVMELLARLDPADRHGVRVRTDLRLQTPDGPTL